MFPFMGRSEEKVNGHDVLAQSGLSINGLGLNGPQPEGNAMLMEAPAALLQGTEVPAEEARRQEVPQPSFLSKVTSTASRVTSTAKSLPGVSSFVSKDGYAADVGVDLGTKVTKLFWRDRKVETVPTYVTISNERVGKVLYFGDEAKRRWGKDTTQFTTYRPLEQGVVTEPEICGKFLKAVWKWYSTLHKVPALLRLEVMCGVPTKCNEGSKRVTASALTAAFGKNTIVKLADEGTMSFLGSGGDAEQTERVIVDIGGGSTDIAVYMGLGQVKEAFQHIKVAGDHLNDLIVRGVKRELGYDLGESEAETAKKEVGFAKLRDGFNPQYPAKGKERSGGKHGTILLDAEQVNRFMKPGIDEILDAYKVSLDKVGGDCSKSIAEKGGTIICGGGALLKNWVDCFAEATGMEVDIAMNADRCGIIGLRTAFREPAIYRKMIIWEG